MKSQRFEVLDGLRGIAAMLVVLMHALTPWGLQTAVTPRASLAVDFFFGLSGFVIAFAYEERLRAGMSVHQYMLRRVIRLYPAILAGLLLGVLVFIARFKVQHTMELIGPMFRSAAANAVSLPSSAFLGLHDEAWPANPPQWSLLFELIASLAFGLGVWRASAKTLSCLVLMSAIALGTLAVVRGGISGGETWSSLPLGLVRVAFPFLAGVLLLRVWRGRGFDGYRSGPLVIGAALCLVGLLTFPVPPGWSLIAEVFVAILAFPALVYASARLSPPSRMAPIVSWLGAISYPLYAIHYPIVRAFSGSVRSVGGTT